MINKFGINFNDDVIRCVYVRGDADAKKVLKIFENSKAEVFGFDTETTWAKEYKSHEKAGLDPHMSRVRLLQLYDPEKNLVAIWDLFYVDIAMFEPLFRTRNFVAHYALFDIGQMRHKGVDVPSCDCTLIMATLLHHAKIGTEFKGLGSLDKCIDREFKFYVPKEFQRSDWSKEELDMAQIRYAALDVYLVWKLRDRYVAKLKKLKLWRVYKLYKAVQQPVVSMMLNGMKMDKKEHIKLITEWEKIREKQSSKLAKIFKGVNLRSPKQVTAWIDANISEEKKQLWPRSDSGMYYATDYETLLEFKDEEFIGPLVSFKKFDKLCTSYGKNLLYRTSPATGRVHGSFTIGQTVTGRMSGDLQQFPRDNVETELYFRKLFIAEPGNVLVVADYSQIEMRIAGIVSGDPVICNAYKKGIDLHKLMGMLMSGKKDLKEVTKEERQNGKPANFGQLYGSGAAGLQRQAKNSYQVVWSLDQSQRNVDLFRTLYKVLRRWQVTTTKLAEKTLVALTPLGRIRKLQPGKTYTVSLNVPIQGGAAEVLQLALVYFDRVSRQFVKNTRHTVMLINAVHDEIIIECSEKEEVVTWVKTNLEDCMIKAYLKIYPTATTRDLVDAHVGKTWADAKG